MKSRRQLSALAGDYVRSERVGTHATAVDAIGRACGAILPLVDQHKHPRTHSTLQNLGRIAEIATIGLTTGAQVGAVFPRSETPTETTGCPPVPNEISQVEVLRAIGIPDLTATTD